MKLKKEGNHEVWRGLVGEVVVASWKGTPIMRKSRCPTQRPVTEKVVKANKSFSIINGVATQLRFAVDYAFQREATARRITPRNAFYTANKGNIIGETAEEMRFDYAHIVLGHGPLAKEVVTVHHSEDVGTKRRMWFSHVTDSEGVALITDTVHVTVYCPERKETNHCILQRNSNPGALAHIDFPLKWVDHPVYLYAFAYNTLPTERLFGEQKVVPGDTSDTCVAVIED
jgi:hypothetical protein